MLATFNHVDQKIRVIFTINITLVTVLVTWVFLLVRLHIFLIGKVSEAFLIGAFGPPGGMSRWLVFFAIS
jgi:hypothetical protein